MNLRIPALLAVLALSSTAGHAAVDLFRAPAGTNATGLELGFSVARAGDVNGDGYEDFIAGAPFDDTIGAEAGRAFLWLGTPSGGLDMGGTPDVVFDDGSGADWFGFAVAGIGDIDDDGYDDVAVGAPGDDRPGEKQGAVYVYYGRPVANPDVTASWSPGTVLSGAVAGDRFGWAISAAGDMDRDGIDDFVVGAPYNDDAPGLDYGRAYLFRGSRSSLSTTPAVNWDGPATGGPTSTAPFQAFAPDGQSIGGPGFGWSIAHVPDFQTVGRSAVAIGAPGAQGATGQVRVFFAASTSNTLPSTTPGTVLTNATAGDRFGWSVASGGQIGGDSRLDLLVGSPGADGARGEVKVFYGAATPPANDGTADLTRLGSVTGDEFGFAVTGIGNHGGSAGGWAVGAPGHDSAGLLAGMVYLYERTASTPTQLPPVNLSGTGEANDRWGWSLAWLGDLDKDGRDDFLVGAPFANVDAVIVRGQVALISSGPGVVSIDDDANDPPLADVDGLGLGVDRSAAGDVRIRLRVADPGPWTLRAYDLRGRALGELANGDAPVEGQIVDFIGRDARGQVLARGSYVVVLEQDGRRASVRLVWTR